MNWGWILDELYAVISKSICQKKFNNIDLYTLRRNTNNVVYSPKQQFWVQLINETNESVDNEPELIEKAWIHFIYRYENDDKIMPEIYEIQSLIKEKIKNPEENDLALYNGLSGLGLELIRMIEFI